MYKKLCFIIASFFGVGYCPKAAGTFGSLATLPFVVVIVFNFGLVGLALFVAASYILGVMAAKEVLKYTSHDPSFIVIDEVCGQAVTFLAFAPFLQGNFSCQAGIVYLAGFGLFRLFDIAKLSLVGLIDRKMENATGVIFDDVVAGVFAMLTLLIALYGVEYFGIQFF